MPVENFPKIKVDFSVYERFLRRKKKSASDTLHLSPTNPQRRCEGSLKIDGGLTGNCELEARVSITDRQNYSARIFADFFGDAPCFRFCSMGRDHMNRETGKGLPSRPVPTPHFHMVDKHGIMRAHQKINGADLADPKVCETVLNSFQSGIKLFCQESNVVSPDEGSIVVKLNTDEMDLSTDDPLANIKFNHDEN